MNCISMKLEIKGFGVGGKGLHRFLHCIREGITDMLGLSYLSFGNAVFLNVRLGIGFTKAVEVSPAEFGELPSILTFFRKASGLVPLGLASNIYVEALVLWHG